MTISLSEQMSNLCDMRRDFKIITNCESCQLKATWIGFEIGDRTDMTCTDQPTTFVCSHWEDHHEVTHQVLNNDVGRARSGPVSGYLVAD